MVGMTGFEPATSCSQRNIYRFFPWFTRLFGAFESENDAFGCSRSHCFHTVRSRRWSKVWSKPNSAANANLDLQNSYRQVTKRFTPCRVFPSAVSIPYFRKTVNPKLSTRKNWCAVDERKRFTEKVPKKELTKQLRRDIIITEGADDGCSPLNMLKELTA